MGTSKGREEMKREEVLIPWFPPDIEMNSGKNPVWNWEEKKDKRAEEAVQSYGCSKLVLI